MVGLYINSDISAKMSKFFCISHFVADFYLVFWMRLLISECDNLSLNPNLKISIFNWIYK